MRSHTESSKMFPCSRRDCAFNTWRLPESRPRFAIVLAGGSTLFLLGILGNQGHMGQDSILVKSMGLGSDEN